MSERRRPRPANVVAATPSPAKAPVASSTQASHTPSPGGRLEPIHSPIPRNSPPPIAFAGLAVDPLRKPALGKPGRSPSPSGEFAFPDRADFTLDDRNRQLRKDALYVQAALDGLRMHQPDGQSAPPTYPFDVRKLEADVLKSSQFATAEERMLAIFRVLEGKVAALASAARPREGDADLPVPPRPLDGLIAPLVEALAAGHRLPELSDTPRVSDAECTLFATSGRAGANSIDRDPLSQNGPPSRNGAASRVSRVTSSAGGGHRDGAVLPAGVLAKFEAIGTPLPSDATLDVALDMLLDVAATVPRQRQVQPASAKRPDIVEAGLASTTHHHETLVYVQQQSQRELETLRAVLAAKEKELQELRTQLTTSRFNPNAPRALATVRDAPMSYEVERQYQRELGRLGDRVKELEADYAALHVSGADDRQKVKDLTAETERLRAEIAEGHQKRAALRAERDEQQSLFSGVSRARGEEARMSLVAVKQLEARVAELSEQLSRVTEEARCLTANGESLWQMWFEADTARTRLASELAEANETFAAYMQLYNDSIAQRLEDARREALKLGRHGDEQLGTITLQKQRLEDAETLRTFSQREQQQWQEKLKSSAEWKILSVKSPEEVKQLSVRLLMLNNDREKREAGMAASHSERLALFQARAAREVNERCERRESHAPVPLASETQDAWLKASRSIAKRHGDEREVVAKQGQGGRLLTTLRYADLKEGYMSEMRRRVVTFFSFFEEEVENRHLSSSAAKE